ncbi:MAG: signal peptidase I [Eubacterium sp.]|nr:signal peptidase I [Eubacterium sp.]
MEKDAERQNSFAAVILNTLGVILILAGLIPALMLTVPRIAGFEMYNVVSGSMEPEIPVGSMVFVKPAGDTVRIGEGDVIAFYRNGAVITHRVVAVNDSTGEIHTKGDANAQEDMETVPYGDVIGIVEHHFPYVGHIGGVLTKLSGKILLFGFIALGVLLQVWAGRVRNAC